MTAPCVVPRESAGPPLIPCCLALLRILIHSNTMPDAVTNLLPRLRDKEWTRILIVKLPEATPVHEAAQLQRDLRRAEIEPFAWVINNSLSPLTVTDPLLVERQRPEARYIREVMDEHATRTAMIAWQIAPPVGPEALKLATQGNSV